MIDYVVDHTVVELKTSENVNESQVCQVALYTFSARDGGILSEAGTMILQDATPALHFARYGVIAKFPMPTIDIINVYPELYLSPVTRLVQDDRWLSTVFDMGEVQERCAHLESFLATKGLRVPVTPMEPIEMTVLGTFFDVLVKIVLARSFAAQDKAILRLALLSDISRLRYQASRIEMSV